MSLKASISISGNHKKAAPKELRKKRSTISVVYIQKQDFKKGRARLVHINASGDKVKHAIAIKDNETATSISSIGICPETPQACSELIWLLEFIRDCMTGGSTTIGGKRGNSKRKSTKRTR